MAKFMTPVIQDNPSGWGPCAVPEQFRDMPYQPFSKGDRLGKVRLCLPGRGTFDDRFPHSAQNPPRVLSKVSSCVPSGGTSWGR